MSRCYRAVVETWSDTTSSIPGGLESSQVSGIMEELADQAGTYGSSVDYSDLISVWIEDGNKFLDFIEALPNDEQAILDNLQLTADDENNAMKVEVVRDLRSNAKQWRSSIDSQGGGSLRFYID